MFSETFFDTYRERLDTIGAWEIDPVEGEIVWRGPEVLRNDWVPFDLRIGTEVEDESGSFDPDAAMFALWESYRSQHSSCVAKFRHEAEELFADDEEIPFGKREVTRADVRITRSGEPGDVFRSLEVVFIVPQDQDHGYYAEYDDKADDWGEISCS
ncbi:MAG: hypothetical protein H7145_05310 [Akkermansiaceae bacterium]|nr:hypothetical protein [Armatimonadota bacterium]